MKYTFLIPLLFVMCQMSCKKDTLAIKANADFSIGVQVLGTHDDISLLSESTNADSIRWDLGNGKTFNKKDTMVSFDSAGIYAITLTAFNKNGSKSSISRKITVKERVIKSISINHLQLNAFAPSQNGLPIFAKADLWIEIKYSQSWDPATPNGDILAPVIYQSPLFANVDSAMHSSLIYNLPSVNKVIINYPVWNSTYPIYPAKGRGTIVNLYAQNNAGTFLLASSLWGGLQIVSGGGDPAFSDNFSLGMTVPRSSNEIKLDCVYQ